MISLIQHMLGVASISLYHARLDQYQVRSDCLSAYLPWLDFTTLDLSLMQSHGRSRLSFQGLDPRHTTSGMFGKSRLILILTFIRASTTHTHTHSLSPSLFQSQPEKLSCCNAAKSHDMTGQVILFLSGRINILEDLVKWRQE